MVVGLEDCCAKKTCGHGEVWHPTCCRPNHRFIAPLVVGGKVLVLGDKFWYNFPDSAFPDDPKGWVQCTFKGAEGRTGVVVKPLGFEDFVLNRSDIASFKLVAPSSVESP